MLSNGNTHPALPDLNIPAGVRSNRKLIRELLQAISNVKGWGSVKIYIQNYKVVQITESNIKKTEHMTNGHISTT